MAKLVSIGLLIQPQDLANAFGSILNCYPANPPPIEIEPLTKEESLDFSSKLHSLCENIIRSSLSGEIQKDEETIPFLEKLIEGTKEQIEALGEKWTSLRNQILLNVLASKDSIMGNEERYAGVNWETRLISGGKGLQGLSQPIAVVQINTTKVKYISVILKGNDKLKTKLTNFELSKGSATMLFSKLGEIEEAIFSHSTVEPEKKE